MKLKYECETVEPDGGGGRGLLFIAPSGSGVAFYRFRFDNFREDAFSVAYAALHEHNTPKTED